MSSTTRRTVLMVALILSLAACAPPDGSAAGGARADAATLDPAETASPETTRQESEMKEPEMKEAEMKEAGVREPGAAPRTAGGDAPARRRPSPAGPDELVGLGELGLLPALLQTFSTGFDCDFDDALSTCQ